MTKFFKSVWGGRSLIKSLSSALFWKRFNLVLTFFWILLVPVAFLTGWVESSTFISTLSLVALILASQSSWQASRVERKADERDPDMDTDSD